MQRNGKRLSYDSRQPNLYFQITSQSVTTKYMFVSWFNWGYHIFQNAKESDRALGVRNVIRLF